MPSVPSSTQRVLTALVTALVAALLTPLVSTTPAQAAPAGPPGPGSITGLGFDACVAPSQSVMDAWNLYSPYSAVGIYVSGSSRYCGAAHQPNLSRAWIAKNASQGWRFLPIHVGYQAPCFTNNPKSRVQKKKMSSSLTTARSQARADAAENIAALKKLGFGAGAVGYLDIEWYDRSRKSCNDAVLRFVDEWTVQMHAAGYKSGLYSSGSAAIRSVDVVRGADWFHEPDHLWFAWGNGKADTDGGPYLGSAGWDDHQRVHQYRLDVAVTHGGRKLTIDKNYLDVGDGSRAGADPQPCDVTMSFSAYADLGVGSRGPQVAALECLLRQHSGQEVVNEYFGTDTRKNLDAFRASLGWRAFGRTTPRAWTALLSAGTSPRVLKRGSVGSHVWRLQRALTAAGLKPRLTGVYDSSTSTAVLAYRKTVGQPAYPTAESTLWTALRRGAIS